jgi:Cu2+-exporting ATPase
MEYIKEHYQVIGMGCAGCALNVEGILRRQEGVVEATVNFANATVVVRFDPRVVAPEGLKRALQAAGYDLAIACDDLHLQQAAYRRLKWKTTGAILLALPVAIIGMFFMHWPPGAWVMLLLTLPVMLFFGRDFFMHACKQLRQGRANMDTLVAVSTGVAFLFSLFNTLWPGYWQREGIEAHLYYEAAAVVIALILLGRLLEARAKSGTATAIKKLMGLQSLHVTRITAGEEEEEIPVQEVRVGDILVVKPGGKVPVDGVIVRGTSFVDESTITGEPLPVEKGAGDPVYAGSINQKGSFRLRAEREEQDTLLARIIRVVREAQGSKAPVQRLVDRVAGIFVPVVLVVSLLTFITWMLVGGEAAFSRALLTAITVLVIACPCALGLATPTAIMVGIGKGAGHHVLIKDAESLELLNRVDTVVLDKTGTLTEGKPVVTGIAWLEAGEEYAAILSGLERQSEHPLAGAVVQAMQGVAPREISDFEAIPGHGVTGLAGGEAYMVGNRRLLERENIALAASEEERCATWEGRGETVLLFAGRGRLLALIAVADRVKEGSRSAIRRLRERGIDTCMLTGDNEQAASAVARAVGVSRFVARALPDEKARFIQELQRSGRVVAMVGDGINDSEALARADVGIAMGKGADIAIDVANVTLLTGDLNALDTAFALSARTLAAIRQNLFWAFIYNVIAIPLAAGVLYPVNGFLLNPMIAAGAMIFSSLSVVLNSLRVKRLKV